MRRTAGDLIAASRRRAVLGREDELSRLRGFVDDERRVLAYLHGPGGVGKTALLDALVADLGRSLVLVDCADLEPGVGGFLGGVARAAGGVDAAALAPGTVLVVDRFENLEQLAGWFWRGFVPALPADVRTLVAGRRPPPTAWQDDPAFAEHAVVLPVRNLPPGAAADLARARGVDDDERVAALVAATHGHPLAIVIATDQAGHVPDDATSGNGVLLDHPDAATRLLGRFLDHETTPLQRTALHVCGHARRVDRALLREVLDLDDPAADELLAWLRERPYAESHPDGLTLHDVVRDALDRDLQWRDRAAFVALHGRIHDFVVDRMMAAGSRAEHDRRAGELLHLHRGNPVAQDLYSFEDIGRAVARPLRRDDPEEARFVAAAFGHEHRAGAAAYWLAEQPEAWTVFEDAHGRRVGCALTARLDLAGPAAAAHDAVAGWTWAALAEKRPPEPGEMVLLQTGVDAEEPGRIGLVSDQMASLSLREWQVRGLGWVVVASAYEQGWAPLWEYIGFERLGGCVVGGDEIGVWARDFTRSPFAEWLSRLAARELDATGIMPPPVATPVALSRADFGDAVRRLLKDLHDPARVRRNQLVDSRLVAGADDPPRALVDRVRQAVTQLGEGPRLAVAARAIDRTYLRPAGSQEKAAEVLGLAFSTYRRHLTTGIERLEALLWDWELHGPPAATRPEREVSRNRSGK